MTVFWIINISVLWIIVLVETALLFLLLRALGTLRQQGRQENPLLTGGLATGAQAPLFVAVDQHNKEMRLESTQGQKRVIVFISPGCQACVHTLEMLDTLKNTFTEVSFLIIGGSDFSINYDYALKHRITLPLLTPTLSDVGIASYHIQAFPFAYILDEKGYIRAKGIITQVSEAHTLLKSAFTSLDADLFSAMESELYRSLRT